MRILRPLALLVGGVLGAATVVGLPAAQASDPSFPTGTFHFDKTSVFLNFDSDDFDADAYANLELSMDTLTDDTTTGPDIVVKVIDGSGRPGGPQLWPNTDAPIQVSYDREGTYSPQVWLTDADHHTTVLDLPQVTVLPDYTSPYVRLTPPKPAVQHRAAGWRVLRGPATDAGIGGVRVHYTVTQKRGAYWYFLNTNYYSGPLDNTQSSKWIKGRKTLAATRNHDDTYNSDAYPPAPGTWRTEPIPQLTKGPIVFCYDGEDANSNKTLTRCITGRITRR